MWQNTSFAALSERRERPTRHCLEGEEAQPAIVASIFLLHASQENPFGFRKGRHDRGELSFALCQFFPALGGMLRIVGNWNHPLRCEWDHMLSQRWMATARAASKAAVPLRSFTASVSQDRFEAMSRESPHSSSAARNALRVQLEQPGEILDSAMNLNSGA